MAVTYNPTENSIVLPTLPTLPKYNTPQLGVPINNYPTQNNTDPSAYFTKALGFLPIDVRYLSNTTNSLAYNSVVDVVLNHAAWQERWGNTEHDWLTTPLGYIPRVVVDTFLLAKHTTFDPIAQGIADDGFKGLMRGASTATLNQLVGLGNTLDALSNPLKGLILEGGQGFVKGLVGDENGRKQYDYNNYIDTGNGFADMALSLGAELVTDPLNWLSFGTKSAISSGSKLIGDAAADTVLKTIDLAIDAGKNSVDDIAEALIKNVDFIQTDDAAKAIARSLTDDVTKPITKDMVKNATAGLDDVLGDSLATLGKSASPKKLANVAKTRASELATSKRSRVKAAFMGQRNNTVTNQLIVSSYLNNLDISKLPSRYLTGIRGLNTVRNVEKSLRYAGGVYGLDLLVGADWTRKKISGHINNAIAEKDKPYILHSVGDYVDPMAFKLNTTVTETTEDIVELTKAHEPVFKKLLNAKDSFTRSYEHNARYKHIKPSTVTKKQAELLKKINNILKTDVADENINTLDDYIKYFKDFDSSGGTNACEDIIKSLEALKRIATDDMSNPANYRRFKKAQAAFFNIVDYTVEGRGQLDSMAEGAQRLAEFRKLQNVEIPDVVKEINDQAYKVDEALTFIAKSDNLDSLNNVVVPGAVEALTLANKTDAVSRLQDLHNTFIKTFEDYSSDVDDLTKQRSLVEAYQNLEGELRYHTAFPEYDVTTASEVKNAYGARPLNNGVSGIRDISNFGTPTTQESPILYSTRYVRDPHTPTPEGLVGTAKTTVKYNSDTNTLYNPDAKVDPGIKILSTLKQEAPKTRTLITPKQEALLKEADKIKRILKNGDTKLGIVAGQYQDLIKSHQIALDMGDKELIQATQVYLDELLKKVDPTNLLDQAKFIKATTYYTKEVDLTYQTVSLTAEDLTKMITDLPTFNIKPLTEIVDIESWVKYQLVSYTLMTRKTYFQNEMLGISLDRRAISKSVALEDKLSYSLTTKPALITEKNVFPFLQFLKDAQLLRNSERVSRGAVPEMLLKDIKLDAEEVYNFLDSFVSEDFLDALKTNGLAPGTVALLRQNAKTALEHYDKVLLFKAINFENTKGLMRGNIISPNNPYIDMFPSLKNYIKQIRDTGQFDITYLENLIQLKKHTEDVLSISDEDLLRHFDITRKPIASTGSSAPLADLIHLYKKQDGDLYKLLNTPELWSENTYKTTIADLKLLITRLSDYKTLVNEMITVADKSNLGMVYKEALMDGLTTILSHPNSVHTYNLDDIVESWLQGAETFLRNRIDTPSVAMDNLLYEITQELNTKANTLTPDFQGKLQAIIGRLSEQKAHDGTVDVDNWVDLLHVSKHSNDARLNDWFDELIDTAKGRYIVVFDIETTGAEELIARPFQIAGKVLDPDGNVVSGSAFNFIIRPGDVTPLPSLKRKLAHRGIDPDVWWQDNIVNATGDNVFDTVEQGVQAFIDVCNKYEQQGFILAGQNIRRFDIDKLAHFNDTKFFEKVDVFDSLDLFNINTLYHIQGDNRILFKDELKNILTPFTDANSPVLHYVPFAYDDIRTLSNFKKGLEGVISGTPSKYVSKTELERLAEEGYDLSENSTFSGFVDSVDLYNIEPIIKQAIDFWNQPSKFSGKKHFIVSKLNPNTYDATVKSYLKELADKGLIDVAPGQNIVQYLNTGVSAGKIVVNAKTEMSYEVSDIFDVKKLIQYASADGKSLTPNTMYTATQAMRRIKNWRKILKQDDVDYLVIDARRFLKTVGLTTGHASVLARSLYDNCDDLTAVAAAYYFYRTASDNNLLREVDDFKMFDNLYEVRKQIRQTKLGYVETPLQHKLVTSDTDPNTQLPRWLYYDTGDYNYVELAELQSDNILDTVTIYNTNRNIYNAHSAAVEKIRADDLAFAKNVEAYLNSRPKLRSNVERAIRHHSAKRDKKAVEQILNRPNRVTALKEDARLYAGRLFFETDELCDLSDFKRATDDFIVIDNIEIHHQNRKAFGHIVLMKKQTVLNAEDIAIGPTMLKGDTNLDDTAYELIKECFTRMSQRVANIGLSRGDILTKETLEAFDDMLRRLGVSQDTIALLPSMDDLTSIKFFDTLRANHSVIGGTDVWQYVMDDEFATRISDPFKQMYNNAQGLITTDTSKRMAFINLIFNDNNQLKDNALFKKLSYKDKARVFKENPDIGIYYIRETKYWNHTKTGVELVELKVVNADSIKIAEDIGAHFLPRRQAEQIMQTLNDYELPRLAQIAKDISDVYKVCYLSSVGFLIRNLIDSNYKTYASLDGTVSLPKSVKHFFQTMTYVRRYDDIGQLYTSRMHKGFKTDLDYELFYKFCNRFNENDMVESIASEYSERYQKQIVKQLNTFKEVFDDVQAINDIKDKLIDPQFFSIIDAFTKSGPSAGLAKRVLNNIPSSSREDLRFFQKFNKWVTEDTPLRYVYGFNDVIEQSARLSMFLQRLELGDSIDSANRAIIKAHFDYADKSLGMLYTEIVFPFMSFSYKNLDFWVNTMYKNPLLVGQMENIFRPLLNYQSLWEPDQEAYNAYDYSFDWSKDVASVQSRIPWTYVNAARLYHILAGNVVIDTHKSTLHDAGYGEKETDLYAVFKLSPSVLDATKMLFNPLDAYTSRILPPFEALGNLVVNMLNDNATTQDMQNTVLTNMLPYVNVITQRVGLTSQGWTHNNILKRTEDLGPAMLLPSVFGTAYVPHKDRMYYYDSDYNVLGGFKTNYYAKRNYSNPYDFKNPRYTITRMAQNRKRKPLYSPSIKKSVYDYQFNSVLNHTTNRIIKNRVKDYKHYY